MNEHEAQRIAEAAHAMRPDWPTASVLTLIRKNLIDKPRRDVAVALAWVACESGTASPARVLETGPWWRAAGVENSSTPRREAFDRGGSCHTCSLPYDKCRRLWADDHDYVSVAEYAKTVNRDPGRIARILESIKGEKQPMRDPEPAPTAEAMARHHADCEPAMDEALARGDSGKAEFIAARCDREHGDLTDA